MVIESQVVDLKILSLKVHCKFSNLKNGFGDGGQKLFSSCVKLV